jgi:hypothetical protein
MKPQDRLQLPDHFAAGGVFIEHLPEQAPESAAEGIGALAALIAGLGRTQEFVGEEGAKAAFHLRESALADVDQDLGRAPPHRGQPGQPDFKKRGRCHIGRYIYRPIDTPATLFSMKEKKSRSAQELKMLYARLRESLAQTGWISQGYVQDRGPGAGGPCYQWTRKVKGKTVSVALSQEQYLWLAKAIGNWRKLQDTLKEMQRLSRQVLFDALPNPKRRKRLGKKVLGLI